MRRKTSSKRQTRDSLRHIRTKTRGKKTSFPAKAVRGAVDIMGLGVLTLL